MATIKRNNLTLKTTWRLKFVMFILDHVKSKRILKFFKNATLARLYYGDKLKQRVTLRDFMNCE